MSHICDTAQVGYLHVPQHKTQSKCHNTRYCDACSCRDRVKSGGWRLNVRHTDNRIWSFNIAKPKVVIGHNPKPVPSIFHLHNITFEWSYSVVSLHFKMPIFLRGFPTKIVCILCLSHLGYVPSPRSSVQEPATGPSPESCMIQY